MILIDDLHAAPPAPFENEAGNDLAVHVDPLTEVDWKEINKSLDRHFSGFFISGVNGKELPWRGEHHLAAMSLFELDPAIDGFEVMPERLTLKVAGKRRTYIPAFRLRRGTTVVMVDVLHRGQERHPLRQTVTATIRAAYACLNTHYQTIPESHVLAQPRLRNARFVLGYRSILPSAEAELAVVKVIARAGPHTVGSVVAALPDLSDARDAVFSLATRRQVKIGLWAKTPADMPVSLLSWGGLS